MRLAVRRNHWFHSRYLLREILPAKPINYGRSFLIKLLTSCDCGGWPCFGTERQTILLNLNCTRTVREMMETVRLPNPALRGAAQKPFLDGKCAAGEKQKINIHSWIGKIGNQHGESLLFSPPSGVSRKRTNVLWKTTSQRKSSMPSGKSCFKQGTERLADQLWIPFMMAKTSKNDQTESAARLIAKCK